MIELCLEITGLPFCPRNRSHKILTPKGKVPFMGKTEAARQYEKAIEFKLKNQKNEAKIFASLFDENKHYLIAEWELTSPDLLTKENRISMNSTDLDAHKVLQDAVMEFVGIDDAYIKREIKEKFQGDYKVSLKLTICELDGDKYL